MKIFYVFAHPQQRSYNTHVKKTAIATLTEHGHEVALSDLYNSNFKATADWHDFHGETKNFPVQYGLAQELALTQQQLSADILAEQQKLQWCDYLILQFPLWWFSMPAILKGWFDRVLTKGFAYQKGHWFNTAPLLGRKALLVTTTQAPASSFTAHGLNGDLHTLLQPIHHALHFIGLATLSPFIAYAVMDDNPQPRQQYLDDYLEKLLNLENESVTPVPQIELFNEKLQRRELS